MVENEQDVLAQAFAMLSSLRKNIDQMTYDVPEKYVNEFHAVLDKLEGIRIDVSDFRIPNSEIAPKVTSFDTLEFAHKPKEISYSREKYVDRRLILYKLDAIIKYLESITSEKPKEIGFRTPKKQ